MGWVKLDDNFFNHRKLVSLSKDAKLLYLAGLCYAGANLTDGNIPEGAIRIIAAQADVNSPARLARQLVDAHLWHVVDGGYSIHDYLEHNTSSQHVRAKRDAAKERMQRARSQNVRANHSRTSQNVREPETETETETEECANAHIDGAAAPDVRDEPTPAPKPQTYPAHFETFWRAYPTGHGVKKQAFEQWRKVPAAERQAVMDGLEAWKASDRWQRGYVKDAQRWLRDRQWQDEPPPPPSSLTVHPGGNTTPNPNKRGGYTAGELMQLADEERKRATS